MIPPALQNLLDRAKALKLAHDGIGTISKDEFLEALDDSSLFSCDDGNEKLAAYLALAHSETYSLTTLIEILVKQNEMLREAVEFMSMPVRSKEATIEGLIESIENDCRTGKEALDFCSKLDEQIAGLK